VLVVFADWDGRRHHDNVFGLGLERIDFVLLPGAGHRRCRKLERLFEYRIGGDAFWHRHHASNGPLEFEGCGFFEFADRAYLDGFDRQRWGDGIQGGALRGSGLLVVCADWDDQRHHDNVLRLGLERIDFVLVSGAGDRRRGKLEWLFEHFFGYHTGWRRHNAAVRSYELDSNSSRQRHAD
jgi:hypothetical protein